MGGDKEASGKASHASPPAIGPSLAKSHCQSKRCCYVDTRARGIERIEGPKANSRAFFEPQRARRDYAR